MQDKLVDNFGRQITYLRLAITDRCNLRCAYCMPEEGINIVKRNLLLTYKEMYRISRVLSELGVNKIRLTGGEPFVRKDFVSFLETLSFNKKLEEINITTNGALIQKHIPKLEQLGIKNINFSLDSLNKENFIKITRRDMFDTTLKTLDLLEKSSINIKLNVVVQSGINTHEINDFIALTKNRNLDIRFIEEMPFNGSGLRKTEEEWNFTKILSEIKSVYTNVEALKNKTSSTSKNYKVHGFKGSFGIIPAFTRTICGDCNRIRLTATGLIKNCLFDDGVFNLRDFIRSEVTDEEIKQLFIRIVQKKPINGFVAEKNRKNNLVSESMSTIGG